MRTNQKLKIGEFSRLMQTTVKTLRHYEQIGLLLPYEIDDATGYCFYQSHMELFAYIEQNGYRISGAPRACYVDGIWNQEDPEKWLSIIQVPVERQ